METRNISITKEKAIEWYNSNDTFKKELALSAFTEKELSPKKTWEQHFLSLPLNGYYISGGVPKIHSTLSASTYDNVIFKTEKQAKSAIAYAQLTQLMALPEYNDNWEPNWNENQQTKYCITVKRNEFLKWDVYSQREKLCFRTKEIRDKFLDNFKELLQEYFEMN